MRRADTKRDQDNHWDFEQLLLQQGKNKLTNRRQLRIEVETNDYVWIR